MIEARIRDFKKNTNIGTVELAKGAGVSRETLWRWENGKSFPSYQKLMTLQAFMEQKEKELKE